MVDPDLAQSPLEGVAHIIQVALTPVFLLSGIAALLNVFSSRLARVADRLDVLVKGLEKAKPDTAAHVAAQLSYLRKRSHALDAAVVLGAIGGGATCVAALALFVGAMRDSTGATLLLMAFGLALVCTFGALAAFLVEVLMATRGLRAEVAVRQSEAKAEEDSAEGAEPGHSMHTAVVSEPDGGTEPT